VKHRETKELKINLVKSRKTKKEKEITNTK